MALEPEAGPMATDTYRQENGQQTHGQIQSGLQLVESTYTRAENIIFKRSVKDYT